MHCTLLWQLKPCPCSPIYSHPERIILFGGAFHCPILVEVTQPSSSLRVSIAGVYNRGSTSGHSWVSLPRLWQLGHDLGDHALQNISPSNMGTIHTKERELCFPTMPAGEASQPFSKHGATNGCLNGNKPKSRPLKHPDLGVLLLPKIMPIFIYGPSSEPMKATAYQAIGFCKHQHWASHPLQGAYVSQHAVYQALHSNDQTSRKCLFNIRKLWREQIY